MCAAVSGCFDHQEAHSFGKLWISTCAEVGSTYTHSGGTTDAVTWRVLILYVCRKCSGILAAHLILIVQVLKVPEGRMMLLSLSAIAIAEGIQTGYHGVKEACADNVGALQQGSLSEGGKLMGMSLRQLYAALSIVIMLMLYINGQRAALQHA